MSSVISISLELIKHKVLASHQTKFSLKSCCFYLHSTETHGEKPWFHLLLQEHVLWRHRLNVIRFLNFL